MSKIITFFLTIILMFESIPLVGTTTLNVDASKTLGEISTKATGFLYGLAENGVPSEAMTNSLDISSVSQKVVGGLQHPTGDVENLQEQLDECDYVVIYLQDAFDTWYYCYDEIMEMRKNGTYDWKEFLYERYLPIVEEKVKYIEAQDYSDNIVYCIFNECDNAVWFGNYVDGYVQYDDTGRQNFYEAWKITYDLVKSIAPDAKIGGPGFCDYVTDKIEGFFTYCKENNCVPEITIYHELSVWSIPDWELHVEDYRRIEASLGIDELPIIVTEYGCMEECGDPSLMLQYIEAMENTGVYGNVAFWRLANNLNDTAADDNSPNSNWWLYRKYAEMEGQRLYTEVSATKDSNRYDYDWRLPYTGIASINDAKDEIDIIVTGSENKRAVKITNLDETNLGSKVTVKVEYVYYKGLTGIVSSPITLKQYSAVPTFGKLNINLDATDSNAVYFITVSEYDENAETIRNKNIPVRYEFENGKLQGNAYTYDSAYATTGEQKGMTGGFENEGDGVKLTFKTSKSGVYDLDIIFGKHNDSWGNPDGRDYATVKMIIDGKEEIISLENTIKSEYTSVMTITKELSAGNHTIEFYHNDGTFVLDSMLVSKHTEQSEISVLDDSNDGSAFLAVAPYDGYYKLSMNKETAEISVDGVKATVENGDIIYLRRGLNEIEFGSTDMTCKLSKTDDSAYTKKITASEITLSDGATVNTDKYGVTYIDGITSNGGAGTFTVNVPTDGAYRVTVNYANNAEGGVHSYNVDLIERYVTVTANGESQDVFCRNTYSKYTYKTMTFSLKLKAGDNTVTLTNSGNTIFNDMTAVAPQIESITVNALTK